MKWLGRLVGGREEFEKKEGKSAERANGALSHSTIKVREKSNSVKGC